MYAAVFAAVAAVFQTGGRVAGRAAGAGCDLCDWPDRKAHRAALKPKSAFFCAAVRLLYVRKVVAKCKDFVYNQSANIP